METKPLNKHYPVDIWLITLLIAPFIMFIIGWVNEGITKSLEGIPLALLFVLFGAIFSFPVLALAYFTFIVLRKYSVPKLWAIIIIDVVSIIGVYVTLYAIEGSMKSELQRIYSCSVIIASIIHLAFNF